MPSATDVPSRPGVERPWRRELLTGLDQAWLMSVELLAGILTWGGIGWLADRWLGTGPWLFAVGALVGNGAGLYLVWLRGERLDAREVARRPVDEAPR